jgi:shikimate kinase
MRDMTPSNQTASEIRALLGDRPLVLVGMMGSGKTAIGRRMAAALKLGFVDADQEIEKAAGKSISEIFVDYGEEHFRDGERKVIARLLGYGTQVLSTGGGAFMSEATRQRIKERGISIWLKAELPLLMRRVQRRDNRPLLKTSDPEGRMRELMTQRHPIYALADITVMSREVAHEVIVEEILQRVVEFLRKERAGVGAQ